MVTIDFVEEGEEARLRSIRLCALKDAPDAFATLFEDAQKLPMSSWREQLRNLPTLVAKHGVDVGMVRGAQHQDDARTLYLISMWVEEAWRGKGVATDLVQRLIAYAKEAGYRRVILDVADDNARALRFYERMGFTATGRRSRLPEPRAHIEEHERELLLEDTRDS